MAEQQGYTKLPNDTIENLAKLPLNGTQFRIILVVIRYTLGFQRGEHSLSETFLANATGIHKKQIQRELNELISFNILTVEQAATFKTSRVIKLNRDAESHQVTKKLPPNKKDTHTGSGLVPSPGSELVPPINQENENKNRLNHSHTNGLDREGAKKLPGNGLDTQERNTKEIYKENSKENIYDVFETVWKLYPRKEGKGKVSKTQKAKLAKIGVKELTRAIERYKRAKEGVDKQYIQHGSTFFNSGYVDYLDANYQETEEQNNGEHRADRGNSQSRRKPWEPTSEASKKFFNQGFDD